MIFIELEGDTECMKLNDTEKKMVITQEPQTHPNRIKIHRRDSTDHYARTELQRKYRRLALKINVWHNGIGNSFEVQHARTYMYMYIDRAI